MLSHVRLSVCHTGGSVKNGSSDKGVVEINKPFSNSASVGLYQKQHEIRPKLLLVTNNELTINEAA